jgi:hypothetical protein
MIHSMCYANEITLETGIDGSRIYLYGTRMLCMLCSRPGLNCSHISESVYIDVTFSILGITVHCKYVMFSTTGLKVALRGLFISDN